MEASRRDREALHAPRVREPLYVNIEARKVVYFNDPVVEIFIRDVSKEVTNYALS